MLGTEFWSAAREINALNPWVIYPELCQLAGSRTNLQPSPEYESEARLWGALKLVRKLLLKYLASARHCCCYPSVSCTTERQYVDTDLDRVAYNKGKISYMDSYIILWTEV